MSKNYFFKLNYSLANEDTRIECDLLPHGTRSVLVVPSSGAQALPLLSKNPESMDIVDISIDQLYLTEIRLCAMRALNYQDWLFFMGYKLDIYPASAREEMFKSLNLSLDCYHYWKQHKIKWLNMGFIYLGKWERFFLKLGSISKTLMMVRFDKFFEFQDLDEQKKYYLKHWPQKRFRLFLKLAASPEFMNRFLYRGSFAGKKNSTAEHLEMRYRSLFLNHLMKKNFFMQFLFLGKMTSFPLEAHEDCFLLAKKSTTKLCYIHSSITEAMIKKPYNFYHLSDVLSYMKEDEAESILSYSHPDSPDNALVISRLFMRGPTKLTCLGWKRRKDLESWASEHDETGVYDFLIYQKSQ